MEDETLKRHGLVRCRCEFCGNLFWSERSTANYCTPSHKQKMYRWRVKMVSQKNKAIAAIKEIESYVTYEKSLPSAVAALNEILSEGFRALRDQRIVGIK